MPVPTLAGLESRTVFVVDDVDAASIPEYRRLLERISCAELTYLVSSDAAIKSLSENYVGLPF